MINFILFLIRLFKYRSIVLGNVKIMPGAFLRYSIVKGDITIDQDASVFRANIVGKIYIGKKTSIAGPFTYLHSVNEEISIGERSAIGPGSMVITSGHDRFIKAKSFSGGGLRTEKKICIGNDVWIGTRGIVLGACEVKDNVTIAAGSVLLGRTYGPNKFYAGIPGREK